jgi:NhaP-type Na+/H+ or K+/H+ antiporter
MTGGIVGCINHYVNMLQVSSAIALWLNIQPADIFFYAFLPPLILDSSLKMDFFIFRKIWPHSLMLAFVMVVISAAVLPPIILFVLGFDNRGWNWVYGALLAAIIAPTDALTVAAVLVRNCR